MSSVATSICDKFGLKKNVTIRQIERLIVKYNSAKIKVGRRYMFYLNEIKNVIREEIHGSGKPYYCGKCNGTHKYGKRYDSHYKNMVLNLP